jgi:hypothetical protein
MPDLVRSRKMFKLAFQVVVRSSGVTLLLQVMSRVSVLSSANAPSGGTYRLECRHHLIVCRQSIEDMVKQVGLSGCRTVVPAR